MGRCLSATIGEAIPLVLLTTPSRSKPPRGLSAGMPLLTQCSGVESYDICLLI